MKKKFNIGDIIVIDTPHTIDVIENKGGFCYPYSLKIIAETENEYILKADFDEKGTRPDPDLLLERYKFIFTKDEKQKTRLASHAIIIRKNLVNKYAEKVETYRNKLMTDKNLLAKRFAPALKDIFNVETFRVRISFDDSEHIHYCGKFGFRRSPFGDVILQGYRTLDSNEDGSYTVETIYGETLSVPKEIVEKYQVNWDDGSRKLQITIK